jgi:hypothetical protein
MQGTKDMAQDEDGEITMNHPVTSHTQESQTLVGKKL